MAKGKSKKTKSTQPSSVVELPVWLLNAKQTFLLFAGLATVLTVILFSSYLFGPSLYIFNDVGSDTLTVFFPNLVQSARYFQEEGWPGWSFYIGLGSNFYPSYILNPLHWIYLPMDPESIARTIAWVQASVLLGTGLVFFRFLREAKFALLVCIVGALIYTFGGYAVLGNSWYGHSYVIFWMTCSFLGFELLLRRKIWWVFPIPFFFILSARGYFLILFMAVYGLVRMLDVYGPSWKLILHGYKRMIVSGVIALLLIAPFIGGKWHKYANSPRVTGNVSYTDRLADQPMFALSDLKHNVTAVMRTFSNDMMGAGNDYTGWRNYLEAPCFYIGLLTLLLVFQFFVLATTRQKWIYGSFLMLWLFIIIFPWFRFAFYGFAGNYYKGALSLFIPFSFLFVGLLGLQEIVIQQRMSRWMLFLSSFVLLILLWYPYDVGELKIQSDMQIKVSVFILGYTALLWMYSAGLFNKLIMPSLIGLISVEALLLAWPAVNDRLPMKKSDIADKQYHFDDSMEAVRRIKDADNSLFYRIDKVYGSIKTGYNDGEVQGFFGSKAYQSHNHKNYVEFLDKTGVIDGTKEANTRWLVGVSTTNILHGLFSIKYLLSNESTQSRVDPAIYTQEAIAGKTIISKNNYYIPFGIPIESYLTETEFEKLNNNERKRSLYFSVIAEEDAPWKEKLKAFPVQDFSFYGTAVRDRAALLAKSAMTMDYFSHKRIKGHIELQNNAMMFFSVPYDIGWQAFVDGEKRELEMIDYGFTGLLLESGKHEIELRYVPPLSKIGWYGMIGAALGILLLIRFRKQF